MRYLHTMIRVRDLDAALHFFCTLLGLKEIRRKEVPAGRFTLVFLGTEQTMDVPMVELTYNWDQEEPYQMGNAFGHLAIGVNDIYEVCKMFEEEGVRVPRPAGPMKGGERIIAFVEDPDGYKIELIQC